MRVFLVVSKQGASIAIAQRIAQEGHRVLFYINDKKAREVGDGLIDKHSESGLLVGSSGRVDMQVFQSLLTPVPDCILVDRSDSGFGIAADRYRKLNFPVIGASEWSNRVTNDKNFQHQVLRMTDIPMAPIDKGIHITTELWFNGKEVVNVNHSMEERSLMEGSKGPQTSGMGTAVWLGNTSSKLYTHGIGKLLPLLEKIKYIGSVKLRTIVDEKALYAMEIDTQYGCSTHILLEMYKGKVNDLFYGIATGVLKTMNFKANLGMGIRLAVLPFPLVYGDHEGYKDMPIKGLNKHNLKHFWGYDVYKKGEDYLVSGNGGSVGTVTARGDEIQNFSPLRDAKRRAMRTINNLNIPDVMYRTDIGNRVEKERTQLKNWGWL